MKNHNLYRRVMDSLSWGMSTWVDHSLRTADPIERVLLSGVQHPSGELFFAVRPINLFYVEEVCLRHAVKIQLERRSREAREEARTKVRTTNKDVLQKVVLSFDQIRWSLLVDSATVMSAINLVSSAVGDHGGHSITAALK